MGTGQKEHTSGWLEASRKGHHMLFSELDILLRALDRFFTMENQPASKTPFTTKNLLTELEVVRNSIQRVLSILDLVIPETNRNAYWFQKFAEAKLMDNRRRDQMRAGMYKQETPEKSLYVLYDSCINFRNLVTDLIRGQDIQYMSFKNIGEIISKELRENVHFNPFRMDINPEFDYIDNREIKEIVIGIADKDTRKLVSIMFLHMFRILRCLKAMDHRSLGPVPMHCSLLIFALIKSEIEVFRSFVEQMNKHVKDHELVMLTMSLTYQITMESKRVFQQELRDIYDRKSPVQLRGKIETSRGILKNLVEQTIIQLARFWNPNIKGEEIFEVFITKSAQSMKLREDTFVLNRMISAVLKAEHPDKRNGIMTMLMNYMDYYENFTFKLLRFDDYEQFSAMFTKIRDGFLSNEDIQKLMDTCHQFNVYLDTTLRAIDNRADLKNRPMDIEKAEEIVKQYLSNI